MVDYMIQTAPRINEIVPKQSEINTRIKEAIKEDVQRRVRFIFILFFANLFNRSEYD